jgi:hypothetical protein
MNVGAQRMDAVHGMGPCTLGPPCCRAGVAASSPLRKLILYSPLPNRHHHLNAQLLTNIILCTHMYHPLLLLPPLYIN